MIKVNPEAVLADVLKDVQKTGNITEYSPEIIRAMRRYAGLCITQLLEEDRIKSANLNDYMILRTGIDKLIHDQK